MTPSDSPFRNHCVAGIARFVQSAIVIDDEAHFGSDLDTRTARIASRPTPSVMEVEPPPSRTTSAVVTPDEAVGVKESWEREPQGHLLNAKAITDAFHSVQVICGLYRPAPEDDAADLATKAAQHADIVVLDWFLDRTNRNSQKAKQVIRRILANDVQEQGRLRLIAIYTGEQNAPTLATEVLADLNADPSLAGRFSLSSDGKALVRDDSRICFLNKPNAVQSTSSDIVHERDLPDRLLREFALVTDGVLATFAVNAIAAVRQASNHLVTLFSKNLDGAYVAHRSRLRHPDDAGDFAVELIADELRNVIMTASVSEHSLRLEVLQQWVDHLSISPEHVFRNHRAETTCSPNEIKELLRAGYETETARPAGVRRPDIEGLFFKTRNDSFRRSLEFARLSNLKREPHGRRPFPAGWLPTLTIGSVVKLVREQSAIADDRRYFDLKSDYLVCVQPRCDSVRLSCETAFPFQSASVSPTEFNLVVKDDETEGVQLLVGWKPRDAVVIRFNPLSPSTSIRANLNGDSFEFIDSSGRKFKWLGDIKDMKAQRSASELAGRIHTPGVDEFEWLRQATEKNKIDFDGRGTASSTSSPSREQ